MQRCLKNNYCKPSFNYSDVEGIFIILGQGAPIKVLLPVCLVVIATLFQWHAPTSMRTRCSNIKYNLINQLILIEIT
jgi:hypothetical protein